MTDTYGFTEEAGHAVDKTEDFDYDGLDSLEDRIRDALARGQTVTNLVTKIVEMQSTQRVSEAIARVVCLIADARKPRLMADQLAWVSGMGSTGGKSMPELARRNRVTKQAFSQAAIRLAKKLGLRPSRAMRSLKARQSMARAYRERHGITKA